MAKLYLVGILASLSLLQVTGSSILKTPTNIIKSVIPASNGSTILDAPTNILRDVISGAEEENSVCYPRLGCFSLNEPWTSLLRPFPAPWNPTKISPTVSLFTRSSSEPYNISLDDTDWSLTGSDFNPNREVTVVMTHGFASSGEAEWLSEMVVAYLKNKDANAFILDWGKGATITNYLQVASNTRIVGAELARFLRHLINNGLKTEKIHLIGHSLGSHIMSYCAKNISEISKVKRITGLDPAQPGFEGNPVTVRLASSDAEEVDVIHTDAKPFIPFFGFGMLTPVGTVDFYMNGGSSQPGCLTITKPNITGIADLVKYPVEVIADWIGCSHGRSYEYFISAMNGTNCSFFGRKMKATETFLKISTLGTLKMADPIVKDLTSCTPETCNLVGLDTFEFPARGNFAVTTTGTSPYCEVTGNESQSLRTKLKSGIGRFISSTFSYIGKKLRFF
ncbi:pancreatic triacylglycerol lipase isoform X2 [Halyomorpha halys]|nr:pancreatic triacylglycerol lipase-like isoform X2 [Halyomorpha halys]